MSTVAWCLLVGFLALEVGLFLGAWAGQKHERGKWPS